MELTTFKISWPTYGRGMVESDTDEKCDPEMIERVMADEMKRAP
jgi:hypothetical protein